MSIVEDSAAPGAASANRGRRGPKPLSAPTVAAPAVLLAIALLGVSALCVRELIVYANLIDADPWLADSAVWIAQLQWRDWMRWAAPAALLTGFGLVVLAVKPRRLTHVPLRAATDIWLRPTDVARLSSARALEEADVLAATTTVTKRVAAVTVTAEVDSGQLDVANGDAASAGDTRDLQARVAARVAVLMADLEQPLKVRVTVLPSSPSTPDQRRRVI